MIHERSTALERSVRIFMIVKAFKNSLPLEQKHNNICDGLYFHGKHLGVGAYDACSTDSPWRPALRFVILLYPVVSVHRRLPVNNELLITAPKLPGWLSHNFIGIILGYPMSKIVSEYDQEIPQSQTAENPIAPRGRATQPSRGTRKTN